MKDAKIAEAEWKQLRLRLREVSERVGGLRIAKELLKNVLRSVQSHGFIDRALLEGALREVDGTRAIGERSAIARVESILAEVTNKKRSEEEGKK